MNKEIYKQLANALDRLVAKYHIQRQDIEPIARMCGAALAESGMSQAGAEKAPEQVPEQLPEQATDEELAGALGGR